MEDKREEIFIPLTKSIAKLFLDSDSFYQIPEYQRPYSWEEEHIEQLWDDIYSSMESNEERYFLGPIILIRREGFFEVVDGQQRMTTLTILFCVLRDLYGSKIGEIDRTLIKSVLDAIISWQKEKPRLKLITQYHVQNEFENEILNKVKFPDKELTNKEKENKKFMNAACIFRKKLEEIEKFNGLEQIKKLIDFIFDKVEVITITCSRQDYAIKLFQILNTRGLNLSPADLIKSELYSRLESGKKAQFMSTWQDIERISENLEESVTDLFTYYEYYILAQNPKRSLYEELTAKFKNQDPNNVIYDFKKFVEAFDEVYNSNSKVIFSLMYLPNQVFWKAITTTAIKEKFSDFNELCYELRRMFYLYWIAGYTTSRIKQLSFNIIKWLKEKRTLEDIREEIEKKIVEDNVVSRFFESITGDVYGMSWLRPLLVTIEYEQTDDSKVSFIELDRKLQVDHILPQKWESVPEWSKSWTKEKSDKWLNKLGNLTLISDKKNSSQLNAPPLQKKIIYEKAHGGKTSFDISKKIIDILAKGEWTESEVMNRQDWMINEIKRIFRLNEVANSNI